MRFHDGLLPALLILGVARVAVGQANAPPALPGSQVSMCVTTQIGTCGNPCEPFQCMPNFTFVSSYETMAFAMHGAPGSPYVLFAGAAVPGCLTIPGIDGQLGLWTPASAVTMGVVIDDNFEPDLFCMPCSDTFYLEVPRIEPGFAFRFQLLGINEYGTEGPVLSFSRATEVHTR